MQTAQAYQKTTEIAAVAVTSAHETQDELKLLGVAKSFGREREIFSEGGSTEFFYKVVAGTVRSLRLLSDGRRQITSFFLPGDIFGVEFGGERGAGAEAVSDTVVIQVRRSAILGDPDQSIRLWRRSVGELQRSQDHALTLGRRSASERLASFLIDLAERLDATDELELPMSRQDIADYLGLTIETVSRTLTQLQGQRLIALTNCRKVRFLDREALEDLCQ